MSKVMKEFGMALSVHYPEYEYPQDLIDGHVMPALRRSYDRARRENWRFAKATTSKFDFMTGPVYPVMDHSNGELCDTQYDSDAECEHCLNGVPLVLNGYNHQFGWYVVCELEEDEDAISQG